MKIISLVAENVKRIVAVEIKPDGNLVQITGKNRQGKTSVLDSIMWAIEGAKHIQAEPIRRGADSAKIRLDLGNNNVTEVIVQRNFYRDEGRPSSLTVMSADGAVYKSPQSMLNSMLDALSFDPLEFSRMKPKDQFDALRKFVPNVNFGQIAMDNKDDTERRTSVGRLRDQARGAAQTAAAGLPKDLPEQPIEESELDLKLEEAGKQNIQVGRLRQHVKDLRQEARRLTDLRSSQMEDAKRLREQADELDERATFNAQRAIELLESADADEEIIPPEVDTQAIVRELGEARSKNALIRKRDEARKYSAQADKLDQEWKAISKRIEDRNQQKRKAIFAANMPVDGLGFGDDCILLNGLPFDQASDAEQLTVSAMIAMSGKPKLSVIRIRDGSLLDDDAMEVLKGLAEKYDMQIWIEKVDSTGTVGFVIEDGHVRKATGVDAVEAEGEK